MRPLETVALALTGVYLLGIFLPRDRKPRWAHHLPPVIAVVMLGHLALEGYRWQMVPAYAAGAILFSIYGTTLLRVRRPDEGTVWWRVAGVLGAVAGLVMVTASFILSYAIPVFLIADPFRSVRGRDNVPLV